MIDPFEVKPCTLDDWSVGEERRLPLAWFGEVYRRYRLPDESAEAASLLFKIIDNRGRERSTTVITNMDFDNWGKDLGDTSLAMGLLDRLVDGAIVFKFQGRSYRAHRAQGNNTTATHPS